MSERHDWWLCGGVIVKHILLGAAVASLSLFGALDANAKTLDFGEFAKNNEKGVADGDTIVVDGTHVMLAAFNLVASNNGVGWEITDVEDDPFAYLDHDGNGDAGLGVCQDALLTAAANGRDNRCRSGAGDDNITACTDGNNTLYDEVLALSFKQDMIINSLEFRDANHGTSFAQSSPNSVAYVGDVSPGGGVVAQTLVDLDANNGQVNLGGYFLKEGDWV